jgi:hypothetical protein
LNILDVLLVIKEVIHLTQELVNTNVRSYGRSADADDDDSDDEDADEGTASTTLDMDEETRAWLSSDWKAGDRCRAVWSEDQQ